MEMRTLDIGSRSVTVFAAADCIDCPIIYMHSTKENMQSAAALLADEKVIIAAIDHVDWNHELTPWPASRVFRNEADFAGGADKYLQELTGIIVPAVEASLGFVPTFRAAAGYSIAGLFAVYALYRTDLFSRAASISGSLWYDGFLSFMKENRLPEIPERVYFSLGDRERITGNQRLAAVEECTAAASQLMRTFGAQTTFEMNPGGHFANVTERIANGIRWLL